MVPSPEGQSSAPPATQVQGSGRLPCCPFCWWANPTESTPLMSPANPTSILTGSTGLGPRDSQGVSPVLTVSSKDTQRLGARLRIAYFTQVVADAPPTPPTTRQQFLPGSGVTGWILPRQGALTMSGDMLGSTTSGGAAGIWGGAESGWGAARHSTRHEMAPRIKAQQAKHY